MAQQFHRFENEGENYSESDLKEIGLLRDLEMYDTLKSKFGLDK